MAFRERFIARVVACRKHQRLTQAELASRLGWSRGAIAHLESGKCRPYAEDVIALARELKVDPEFLLTGSVRP